MNEIETERSCRQLVVRCIRALDERDYDGVAKGFAVEGVWSRGGEELVGPDAVRAALDRRPADLQTQHIVSNLIVDLDAHGVSTVRYTLCAYAQQGNQPYHLHGIFKAMDKLTETVDGWRFAHRSVTPAFPAAS